MDLPHVPVPYEITSDQDVASMFIIPVTKEDSEESSEEYFESTNRHQNGTSSGNQPEDETETNLQSNDGFNPSDILAAQNDHHAERRVLNSEDTEMDTDVVERIDGSLKNGQRTMIAEATNSDHTANIVNLIMQQSRKQFSSDKSTSDAVKRTENSDTCEMSSGVRLVGVAKPTIAAPVNMKNKGTLQCPTCKCSFPINADLTRHQCAAPNDGSDILSCTICKTIFDEMDKLKDHMRKHWESLPYKCHVCSERYWTEKSLKRHLIKHETREKPFACVECNAKYVHKRQLLLHMANVHSRDRAARKYPCDICGRNFLRKCDLTKHVKKCVDLEDESPLLERDNSPIARDIPAKNSGAMNSPSDSRDDKANAEAASEINHNSSQLPVEAKRPKPAETVNINPTEKESAKEKNNLVPGVTIPTSNLMNILSSIQGSGIPAIVPFLNTNGLGANVFASPLLSMFPLLPMANVIGQPAASTSDPAPVANQPANSSTDTAATPPLASVKLSSRRKSRQPKRTVSTLLSDLPPKKSDVGGKVVDVLEIIRRSKKLAREDDKAPDPKEGALYNCQVCSKSFPTLSELQLHCASHGSNVFSCKYCKKVLSSQVSLYRHEADHEDNRPFKCDTCDKAFVLKAELNRHTDIQHSKRPFTCKVCRFNFSCQANLDAHMPVHIEKRACPLCPRSFTTETYLQRHLARHHDIVDTDSIL